MAILSYNLCTFFSLFCFVRDELMIEDVAVEILNEFCQDSSVPVSVRLGILQLLEKVS